MRAQNLNLLIFAKTWLLCNRFCERLGIQGEPLVPFLSPFLCGTTKKWHFCYHRAREAGEAVGVFA
jgi:hypothetical protein